MTNIQQRPQAMLNLEMDAPPETAFQAEYDNVLDTAAPFAERTSQQARMLQMTYVIITDLKVAVFTFSSVATRNILLTSFLHSNDKAMHSQNPNIG